MRTALPSIGWMRSSDQGREVLDSAALWSLWNSRVQTRGLTGWLLSQKRVPDYVSNSLLQGGGLPTWLYLL